jgi:hypothetical protein
MLYIATICAKYDDLCVYQGKVVPGLNYAMKAYGGVDV